MDLALAALHAGHRGSFDHVHLLTDPVDRYQAVLAACHGAMVVAPTAAEALRVKAHLAVQRNVVRDSPRSLSHSPIPSHATAT